MKSIAYLFSFKRKEKNFVSMKSTDGYWLLAADINDIS